MILPTAFEVERHKEKGLQVTSLKEEWEIISGDPTDEDSIITNNEKPLVSSIVVSDQSSLMEARATLTLHPQTEGKRHVELNAISVSATV